MGPARVPSGMVAYSVGCSHPRAGRCVSCLWAPRKVLEDDVNKVEQGRAAWGKE